MKEKLANKQKKKVSDNIRRRASNWTDCKNSFVFGEFYKKSGIKYVTADLTVQ